MIDTSLIQLIALIVTIVGVAIGAGGAIFLFLDKKVSEGDKEVTKKVDGDVQKLHLRINGVEREYIPRREHDKEINRIHDDTKQIRDLIIAGNAEHKELIQAQNARIDKVLMQISIRG